MDNVDQLNTIIDVRWDRDCSSDLLISPTMLPREYSGKELRTAPGRGPAFLLIHTLII